VDPTSGFVVRISGTKVVTGMSSSLVPDLAIDDGDDDDEDDMMVVFQWGGLLAVPVISEFDVR